MYLYSGMHVLTKRQQAEFSKPDRFPVSLLVAKGDEGGPGGVEVERAF